MQELPHRYTVEAKTIVEAATEVSSDGLPTMACAPPAEFGGPGDQWSPETLLVAAVADCFVLSFKAVSRASKFEWSSLSCQATGTLDRIDRVTQFTEYQLVVNITLPAGSDKEKAQQLLEKAEHVCLISNSLKGESLLSTRIHIAD